MHRRRFCAAWLEGVGYHAADAAKALANDRSWCVFQRGRSTVYNMGVPCRRETIHQIRRISPIPAPGGDVGRVCRGPRRIFGLHPALLLEADFDSGTGNREAVGSPDTDPVHSTPRLLGVGDTGQKGDHSGWMNPTLSSTSPGKSPRCAREPGSVMARTVRGSEYALAILESGDFKNPDAQDSMSFRETCMPERVETKCCTAPRARRSTP